MDKVETLNFKKFAISISNDIKDINFKYDLIFPNKIVEFNYGNNDLDETNIAFIVNKNPSILNLFSEGLEEFKRLSIENDFIPIITYIPSAYTAYEKFVKFKDPSITRIMQNFSLAQRNSLSKNTKKQNINFIDFTSALWLCPNALTAIPCTKSKYLSFLLLNK